ncbi:hypothetical protein [Azoarcus sp. DN11]|uniref:hypothetical protein n=1 Tax=Azoarcus sp. DN11 TaxID=356837 RepID=UPI000EB24B7D|nr:hypothetical protein [Azoarcus sp. DN11]AYH45481.1 hypothetical protein CDA09_19205 [Azoarcus sp. DN11]
MMFRLKRHALSALMIVALGGSTTVALAQSASNDLNQAAVTFDRTASAAPTRAAESMAKDFSPLVGSQTDALALIQGLHTGTAVVLQPGSTATPESRPVTVTPTAPMGYGNVFITLALAQASLTQAGITKPTSAELAAALTGGTIVVNGQATNFQGILTMRAAGMGWGKIAQENGFKLGRVISAIKSGNERVAQSIRSDARAEHRASQAEKAEQRGNSDAAARAERAEKAERPSRPEKVERVERAERVERPERPERPERIERPERVERPEKVERPTR